MAGRRGGSGVGRRPSYSDLSPLEFELLRLLYRRLGKICPRDEIMAALYPNEKGRRVGQPPRFVDAPLRKAIEPTRYLLTVRVSRLQAGGHANRSALRFSSRISRGRRSLPQWRYSSSHPAPVTGSWLHIRLEPGASGTRLKLSGKACQSMDC